MSNLQFHNSESGKYEQFTPLSPDHIGIYVCGPTVYDHIHIGNARPIVIFDLLVRLLRHISPKVTFVRNITDVDDKIIQRANDNQESIDDLTQRMVASFHQSCALLGCAPPDHEPRATQHIGDMIDLIQCLIDRNHAYEADNHVLFHVPSMADYGKFANRDREQQIAGARVEIAPYKRDEADFVLWKPSDITTCGWDSPWGFGRPGWHIECSAMSKYYLGDNFDIHGGGLDLIFPHHQNEIAQSRCSCDHAGFARYWLHNGYLLSEGQKMSKSLGNFYTVKELTEDFKGEALRLVLLRTHYRQPLDFTKAKIGEAQKWLDRFYEKQNIWAHIPRANIIDYNNPIINALCHDINTPLALTHIQKTLQGNHEEDIAQAKLACEILGILCQDCNDWFGRDCADGLSDAQIDDLIKKRQSARNEKDFALADAIRDQLNASKVIIRDTANGIEWRRES